MYIGVSSHTFVFLHLFGFCRFQPAPRTQLPFTPPPNPIRPSTQRVAGGGGAEVGAGIPPSSVVFLFDEGAWGGGKARSGNVC